MKRIIPTRPIAIQLSDLTKKYEIHHEKPTLVEKFVKGKNETFWALNHVNLTIYRGENVGIIGPNGSGKTTLLKIIAGITTPTGGTVSTNGKIVSLIDLEAGFQPDLTGFQNIYLNGMLLGMTKRHIDARLSKIIAFADIRQFIDAPLFTYSSGMALRLGFAIAVQAEPDILLMDENFSVGDEAFRKKAFGQIAAFRREKKTILIVSHWQDFVKKNASRIISMKEGRIVSG
jgi:ABC-type polysaccharide/polyol phosphate transport system ATPase subunit